MFFYRVGRESKGCFHDEIKNENEPWSVIGMYIRRVLGTGFRLYALIWPRPLWLEIAQCIQKIQRAPGSNGLATMSRVAAGEAINNYD